MVVLADRSQPSVSAHLAALRTVTGYLLWREHDAADLAAMFAALAHRRCVIISRGIQEAIAQESVCTERLLDQHRAARQLTSREARVLLALIDGLTQREIAAKEGIPLRSVHRTVADLQQRADAPTSFVLGMYAWRLMLGTEEQAKQFDGIPSATSDRATDRFTNGVATKCHGSGS